MDKATVEYIVDSLVRYASGLGTLPKAVLSESFRPFIYEAVRYRLEQGQTRLEAERNVQHQLDAVLTH